MNKQLAMYNVLTKFTVGGKKILIVNTKAYAGLRRGRPEFFHILLLLTILNSLYTQILFRTTQ